MKRLAIVALIFSLLTSVAQACGFDGAGNYTRCYNWQEDKANGIKVVADRMDTEMDTMADGLSSCVLKDGTQTVTADIGFSNFRLKNVAAATALTDACQTRQVQNNSFGWADDAGAANAYTALPTLSPGSYTEGQIFWVKLANTNTASSTLNVAALGAKTIKKGGTTDVAAGDLVSGGVYPFYYDGTNFQVAPVPVPTYGSLTGIPTQLAAVSNSLSISLTSLQLSGTIVGGVSVTGIVSTSGGLNSAGPVTATNITASATISGTAINGGAISGTQLALGGYRVSRILASATIQGTLSPSIILNGFNVASVQNVNTGKYGISFTTPLPDTNYQILLTPYISSAVGGACIGVGDQATAQVTPTTAGFRVDTFNCTGTQQNNTFSLTVVE